MFQRSTETKWECVRLVGTPDTHTIHEASSQQTQKASFLIPTEADSSLEIKDSTESLR